VNEAWNAIEDKTNNTITIIGGITLEESSIYIENISSLII
jgi:hypothetical protein